jgi:hypothetical protein
LIRTVVLFSQVISGTPDTLTVSSAAPSEARRTTYA